jgi:hypothetical protein
MNSIRQQTRLSRSVRRVFITSHPGGGVNVASGGDQTTQRNFSPENVLAFRLGYTNLSSFHWVSRLITSRKCLEREPNVYSIALARAADRLIHLLSVRRLFLAWRMKNFALTVLRVAAQREKFSAFTCSFQSISVVIESPRHCTMCSPCPKSPDKRIPRH